MLDKTKKFGTVHGMPGVKYSQGGKLFDGRGVEVDDAGEPMVGALEPGPVVEASGVAVDEDVAVDEEGTQVEAPAKKSTSKKRRWV